MNKFENPIPPPEEKPEEAQQETPAEKKPEFDLERIQEGEWEKTLNSGEAE